jgi:heterotetrameric sarcosine oxidase delta subunit
MILLPCPWCGPRDAGEFAHSGERTPRPEPGTAAPAEWRAYLYLRANTCGWVTETWYHRMGCRRFITVERHTETNETRMVPPGNAAAPAGQAAE